MNMREKVARAICAGLGYYWDNLYEDKAEWIDDRGSRYDINTPFRPDFLGAADDALDALMEPDDDLVSEAAWEACDQDARAVWQAMLRAVKEG